MKKYLAIDLGGTAIKYGIVDEELNFLSKGKIVKDWNHPQAGFGVKFRQG